MRKTVQCKSVPCLLPEHIARKVDELVKTLPTGCDYQRKAVTVADYHFEPNERAEVSILSTATVDKSNEVVLPEGVDLTTFNGTVLYNHDPHQIVGRSVWVKHVPKDNSLRAKTEYFENQDGTESKWYKFVDEVWTMVKAGALRAKSIGFQPLTPKRDPSPEELASHPDWQGAGIWDKALLLEYSVCPIGINNDALVEAINTKSIAPAVLKALGLPEVTPCPCQKAGDDCVSRKIKWMHDNGEGSKYSDDQIVAIAYAHCHGKKAKKAKKVKKAPDLAAILEKVDIDFDRVVSLALETYRNRGSV